MARHHLLHEVPQIEIEKLLFSQVARFLQFFKCAHLKCYLFGGNMPDTAYCMIIAKLGLN